MEREGKRRGEKVVGEKDNERRREENRRGRIIGDKDKR